MNVKELKQLLTKFDDNIEVLISMDSEGNMYHNLDDIYHNKTQLVLYPNDEDIEVD